MILQTTLCLAAAAAVINLWLGMRCGKLRHAHNISHGDGGNPALMQRMRAHANFGENTPLALILLGLVEAAGKGGTWLAIIGGIFMLGRVAHGLGMDVSEGSSPLRMFGTLSSMLILLILAVICVLIALGRM